MKYKLSLEGKVNKKLNKINKRITKALNKLGELCKK